MKQEVLSIQSGTFKVNHHTILKSIFVQLYQRETVGILFNNSEEKEVFLQFLMGKIPMHYGQLYIDDEQIPDFSQKEILQQTVYVVRNPSSLSKQFTILENLFYGKFKSVFLSTKKFEDKAKEIFLQFNLDLDPSTMGDKLTGFECILIEILKAYVWDYKIIVLSNITGALDLNEKTAIIKLLDDLKKLGLSFFIIGAFEEILMEHTDNITIIQGGQTIGTYESNRMDTPTLHKLLYTYSLPLKEELPVVPAQNIFTLHHITNRLLKDLTLSVHRGEAIKIIYSDDASARSLEAILKGNNKEYEGNIYINQTLYRFNTIEEALKNGIAFIEENPIQNMLFKNLTIIDNICYPLSSKIGGFWLRKKYQRSVRDILENIVDPEDFKKNITDVPTETLYLIIYCKWLLFMPKVLVCLNPFSVADVQINQIITQMINYLTDRGVAVIILTSYWPPVCSIQGRTFYLEQGRLVIQNNSDTNYFQQ